MDIEPASEASPGVKKQRQRRPWWEELFSEDFVRANFKVSDAQVRREVNFIEESLGVAPGGVVLDLGCGAGHHAVELASRGYGVVGYDLSLYQLALAAEVAQERDQKINFLQGDMREMAFEEMFDGVFSWNTSFGYFEEEKNLNVAQRVFHALKPGGMFLVDVINRDFAAAQSPSSVWYEGDACVCMDDMSVDFITSRLRVKRSVILDDGRTREVQVLGAPVLAARAREAAARGGLPRDGSERAPGDAGCVLRGAVAAHHHAGAEALRLLPHPLANRFTGSVVVPAARPQLGRERRFVLEVGARHVRERPLTDLLVETLGVAPVTLFERRLEQDLDEARCLRCARISR